MKWVTRERPVIDRIACPWLVARFIDEDPEFLEASQLSTCEVRAPRRRVRLRSRAPATRRMDSCK
ncbi:chromate resistance protein ChrB domain-containing protein [Pseudaminobacter soli (ex Li et al. 2025)]|uniref:chromate resistance protein ChrB domain-containing protein n=1 Tax=Pseudaminobacter soli (ex Li et al. 2025) TaxID=1295366 RepID=UPI001FE0A3F2|nr:chromate resistance protein ChrB domain-containing protein [Mesorhizobium soli]